MLNRNYLCQVAEIVWDNLNYNRANIDKTEPIVSSFIKNLQNFFKKCEYV